MKLLESIKPLFANKPLLLVMNKADILRMEELPPHKGDLLKNNNLPKYEMSTLTDFGVMEIKEAACERLLAFRIDNKMKTKKVICLKIFQC
jgi:nucleolar GTP-binding protein